MTDPVHVIGATGRTGLTLCRSLLADGVDVVPVVRNADKWAHAELPVAARLADLRAPAGLAAALAGAGCIVSCAHAHHTPAILAAAPAGARFVLLGSTRKFTRWPDPHGNGVLAGERALLDSGRPGVMLHPTMIYGAQGEDNVQRLAALMRRMPFMPLPGGGRFLVQPIYQADVVRCIRAALAQAWTGPSSMVIAGADAVPYADLVRAVALAAGLKKPLILPFPTGPLIAAAKLTRHVRALPVIKPEEIRRLTEDKAFPAPEMREVLRVIPISLADGLALTFRADHDA